MRTWSDASSSKASSRASATAHFVRRAALRLGVSGWVRNRADGSVEALVAGPPAEVEMLLAEMRRGPPGATVTSLRLAEPGDGEVTAGPFVILPTV